MAPPVFISFLVDKFLFFFEKAKISMRTHFLTLMLQPPSRDPLIMLEILPIMLCYTAQKLYLLCSQVKLHFIEKIDILYQNSQLSGCSIRIADCSIRVYQSFSVPYNLTSKDFQHGTRILHRHLLCSKLCRHNRRVPNSCKHIKSIAFSLSFPSKGNQHNAQKQKPWPPCWKLLCFAKPYELVQHRWHD